jgi:centriolar protein POC1
MQSMMLNSHQRAIKLPPLLKTKQSDSGATLPMAILIQSRLTMRQYGQCATPAMDSCCSDDKTLKVFKTEEKKFQFSLVGHKNWVRVGTFSPDSRLIASGGDDKTVFIWDTESKSVVTQYHDHLGIVYDAKFNPDGTCLASCSQDKKIKLFDMRAKRQIQHYDAHGDAVYKIDFHPNSNYLISSSADSKIKVHSN